VFTNTAGGPLWRTHFRTRDWRLALVRAGLLGKVTQIGPNAYLATWPDVIGRERSAEFGDERKAIAHVAKLAAGGLRFHDLRHSYATWLVSDRVPINDIAAVMGHEHASTTLNLYTHRPDDRDQLIRDVFDDFSLSSDAATPDGKAEEPSEQGS
jgi:integrase